METTSTRDGDDARFTGSSMWTPPIAVDVPIVNTVPQQDDVEFVEKFTLDHDENDNNNNKHHNFPPHITTPPNPDIIDPLSHAATTTSTNINFNITYGQPGANKFNFLPSLDEEKLRLVATIPTPNPYQNTDILTPEQMAITSIPFLTNNTATYAPSTFILSPALVSPIDAVLDPKKTRCTVQLSYFNNATSRYEYRTVLQQTPFIKVTKDLVSQIKSRLAAPVVHDDDAPMYAALHLPALSFDVWQYYEVTYQIRCHFTILSLDVLRIYPLANNAAPITPRAMFGFVLQHACHNAVAMDLSPT